jgi:hypothetical protein
VGQTIRSYLRPSLAEAVLTKILLLKYGFLLQSKPFGIVPFVEKGFIRNVNLIILDECTSSICCPAIRFLSGNESQLFRIFCKPLYITFLLQNIASRYYVHRRRPCRSHNESAQH